jgi:hypothetical protein
MMMNKMSIFNKLIKKEKIESVDKNLKDNIKVSFDLSELQFLYLLKIPESIKERVQKTRNILKQKAKELVGIEVGSKEWGDIVRLQTLISSDPETSKQIQDAKEIFNRVYGMKIDLSFSREELKTIIDAGGVYGPSVDSLKSKLSRILNTFDN